MAILLLVLFTLLHPYTYDDEHSLGTFSKSKVEKLLLLTIHGAFVSPLFSTTATGVPNHGGR